MKLTILKETKEEKRGGKRNNSGRKPLKDKKIPFTIYIRKSSITKKGRVALRNQLVTLAEK